MEFSIRRARREQGFNSLGRNPFSLDQNRHIWTRTRPSSRHLLPFPFFLLSSSVSQLTKRKKRLFFPLQPWESLHRAVFFPVWQTVSNGHDSFVQRNLGRPWLLVLVSEEAGDHQWSHEKRLGRTGHWDLPLSLSGEEQEETRIGWWIPEYSVGA